MQQGGRKLKEKFRAGTSQNEERIDEGIGFDESAIQIDADRLAADRCCVWLGKDF